MGDKMRDPKTGRFVKSGTGQSVPVRDSDDDVIENLRERLCASARRVHDLEKIIRDQDNLIEQLQRDALTAVSQSVNQDEAINAARARNRAIAFKQAVATKALFEEWAKEDADSTEDDEDVVVNEEPVVPEPKRGHRPIAWGLAIGGCILFWYGIAIFFFGGK